MDKNILLKVLQNCAAQSVDEAQAIISLKSSFPFSQVLQVISAKVSKDFRLVNQERELQRAAVYCADRAVLKDIMTYEFSDAPPYTSTSQNSLPDETDAARQKIETTIDGVDVADVVMRDLKKLSQLKHNFEMLFDDQTKVSLPVVVEHHNAEEAEKISDIAKSRRERIIELAKSMNTPAEGVLETDIIPKKRKEQPVDNIIEEIKTTKDEIEPESERQKLQINLIDHFIKAQPSITSVRDRNPLPPPDLTAVKPGEFGENIVSETLVEILIKQGKKERAIEVLKKLIWKYPQKKAYFASQIEDLKK